jgi:RNA-directed DNA polymerase
MATRTTTTTTTHTESVVCGVEFSSPKLFDPGPLTLERLFDAYFACRRTKRNATSQLRFEIDLEANLMQLWRDLTRRGYHIGPSTAFVVQRPKIREVWAAGFRDRIVHHLITNALTPHYYPRFIRDTYGCIPGRGIHDGMRRVAGFARSITRDWTGPAYALKVDVANFFGSIDHAVLLSLLEKRVQPGWCLELVRQVIQHDPRKGAVLRSPRSLFNQVPRHKSLMHAPPGIGLPIGNLTSQFFANLYMNELDQHIKHGLKARYYGRYVDDIVLFHENADILNRWCAEIDSFLQSNLRLRLHPRKKWLNRADAGLSFIGFIIKPKRIYLRRSTLVAAHHRITRWNKAGACLDYPVLKRLGDSLTSTLGLLRQTNGFHHRKRLCIRIEGLFLRADVDCTKIWTAKPASGRDRKSLVRGLCSR